MIDRLGLADFLRRRREALQPADVGLPAGSRRRTPGLRREEVAQLAGISSDHYGRLEQARGSAPSASVVGALARALRCDQDQSDHLFHLAGLAAPRRPALQRVSPRLIEIAQRLHDVPLRIHTDLSEVLWANDLMMALSQPDEAPGQPGYGSNLIWRWFTVPKSRERVPQEDWDRISAVSVSDLRATAARRAGDEDVHDLVQELLERSAEFRQLWERHDVHVRRSDRKQFRHPEVGLVRVYCEILLTPGQDISLLAFFPLEVADAEKLDLLRVIGTQDFAPVPPRGH